MSGQAIRVAMTDLLENDRPVLVENECRRIGRFMRGVPTEAVRIGHLVIRIGDQNDIGGQVGLLRKEFFGVLIQVSRWSGIDQEDLDVLSRKIRGMLNEIVDLFHAERALITGEAPQQNQHQAAVLQFLRHLYGLTGRGRKGEVWGLGADRRSFGEQSCSEEHCG